jgi:hypothetical protein
MAIANHATFQTYDSFFASTHLSGMFVVAYLAPLYRQEPW